MQDFRPLGLWNLNWPYRASNPTIYPTAIANWPGHERWFSQRSAPLTGEFTIHQSQLWSITTYGALMVLSPIYGPSVCLPVNATRLPDPIR